MFLVLRSSYVVILNNKSTGTIGAESYDPDIRVLSSRENPISPNIQTVLISDVLTSRPAFSTDLQAPSLVWFPSGLVDDVVRVADSFVPKTLCKKNVTFKNRRCIERI